MVGQARTTKAMKWVAMCLTEKMSFVYKHRMSNGSSKRFNGLFG
jgi:hypothetical protein